MVINEAEIRYAVQWLAFYVMVYGCFGVLIGLWTYKASVRAWRYITKGKRYREFVARHDARIMAGMERARAARLKREQAGS